MLTLVVTILTVSFLRCMAMQLDRIEDMLGLKWERVEVMMGLYLDRMEILLLDELQGMMDFQLNRMDNLMHVGLDVRVEDMLGFKLNKFDVKAFYFQVMISELLMTKLVYDYVHRVFLEANTIRIPQ